MPKPKPIYLKDYKTPDFFIDQVFLDFDLYEKKTVVKADLHIRRNGKHMRPLILNGDNLKLLSIALNDMALKKLAYKVTAKELTIVSVPNKFILQTKVAIEPHKNTALEGLYKSKNIFCTQCEPHGFRRITYFQDRPDVMAKFTVTIHADKKRYPDLLTNGNLIAQGESGKNRHWGTWEDPSLKPCYLFALVAGSLDHIEDKFITKSSRKVALKVYVEKGQTRKCRWAMQSLKEVMRWEENVFGLEYDLNNYMIVAISDFNIGAMENKGLNIFNKKYVLADSKTATDEDYLNIENVVAHEYLHNWTGNRITLRDWFQLSLKEGLTLFRDQQFSAAMVFSAISRIKTVNVLRSVQFPEDAGPMRHPVKPKSYIEINNFYTATVYKKGAEVIRMLYVLLGEKKFLQGMKLYVKRYDGHAATTEDFVQAMQDASGINLDQFKKWYDIAGTPVLNIKDEYDSKTKTYKLHVKQNKNLHIPIAIGLLDKNGKDIPRQPKILSLKNKQETYKFTNIKHKPIPSLLRNFSAPVRMNYPYSNKELMFLMAHDSDEFNRWNAGQQLAINIIISLVKDYQRNRPLILNPDFIESFRKNLYSSDLGDNFIALMLSLPTQASLIDYMDVADVEAIFKVSEFIKAELAKNLHQDFLACYKKRARYKKYNIDNESIGRRSLKNLCLYYLTYLGDQKIVNLCMQQFNSANNMTDTIGSLRSLVDLDISERKKALASFYKKWQHEELVINKWLELQALSKLPDALSNIKALVKHPAFDIKNPNKVYALIRTFARANHINFHNKNGRGYRFLADQVIVLNKINPMVAAFAADPLIHWHKFDQDRQKLMKQQLQRIKQQPRLSKNVYEVVMKGLA